MKITEHEMLVTIASMAIKMNDLTGHDVIEALRELGYKDVITQARESEPFPVTGTRIRDEVLWFAEQMEDKLRKNDHKGHWSNCTNSYLLRRIAGEGAEMHEALRQIREAEPGDTTELVAMLIRECADIANFAMMLADNARK